MLDDGRSQLLGILQLNIEKLDISRSLNHFQDCASRGSKRSRRKSKTVELYKLDSCWIVY